jgi:hypothetical protein
MDGVTVTDGADTDSVADMAIAAGTDSVADMAVADLLDVRATEVSVADSLAGPVVLVAPGRPEHPTADLAADLAVEPVAVSVAGPMAASAAAAMQVVVAATAVVDTGKLEGFRSLPQKLAGITPKARLLRQAGFAFAAK